MNVYENHIKSLTNDSKILLLDTCAILDIIRSIARGRSCNMIKAMEFMHMKNDGVNCQIFISFLIQEEYKRNLKDTIKVIDSFFEDFMENSSILLDVLPCMDINHKLSKLPKDVAKEYKDKAMELVSWIFKMSTVLPESDKAKLNAHDRVRYGKLPSRKGGGMNDCTIIENYFEFSRFVKEKFPDISFFFLSSNTKDFLPSDKQDERIELEKEFISHRICYCHNWGHFLHELKG